MNYQAIDIELQRIFRYKPPSETFTGRIPPGISIRNGQRFLFISKEQRAYTHSIHKYPAKFFPELPRFLIERYSKRGDIVLDPFMGSGTTNLECMLHGRGSIGVDVDPFSRLLTRVKTTPLSPIELAECSDYMNKKLSLYNSDKPAKESPDFPYRKKWFTPNTTKELAFIKYYIDKYPVPRVRDFMRVTFSSIIRKVSQADDHCTRTVIRKNRPKKINSGYCFKVFRKRLINNINGMRELYEKIGGHTGVTIPDNCTATNITLDNDSIDMAVTSPPYLNAVDYPRTHQLETYWLGIANGSLRDHKALHIGTEVVSSSDYNSLHLTGIKTADKVIRKIYKVDPRRAYIASKYITDMGANLSEVRRVLKPGGVYSMVIGSNKVRGHTFENWRYVKEAAKARGFTVKLVFVSEIINHFIRMQRPERINDDYVLILQK